MEGHGLIVPTYKNRQFTALPKGGAFLWPLRCATAIVCPVNDQELDAIARRVAEYLRDRPEIALGEFDNRQLLPLADATSSVMLKSKQQFHVWCKAYRVTAFRHGQYRRQDLIDGLKLEASVMAMRARRRGRKKPRQKVIKEIISAEPLARNPLAG
ncbi:MAG: hypothetical protein ABI273_15020 [Lacunisphaera sp.]